MNEKQNELAREMERYYAPDRKRIEHSYRVTAYAEELLKIQGGDPEIVVAAGLLHDVGIPVAKEKYGTWAPKYQEKEGPPVARKMLEKLGYPPDQMDEICEIIAHHHTAGIVDTVNFKVVYDADWLVNLKDHYNVQDTAKLPGIIEKVFLTPAGKALATSIFLSETE